jgi:hypothetical protein
VVGASKTTRSQRLGSGCPVAQSRDSRSPVRMWGSGFPPRTSVVPMLSMPNAGRRAVVGRRTSGHARESLTRLLVRSAPTRRWTSPVRALTSMAANIAVAAPIHPDEQRLSRSRSTARASRRARLHSVPSTSARTIICPVRRIGRGCSAVSLDIERDSVRWPSARSTRDRGGAWHPESQGLDRTARSGSTRGCAGRRIAGQPLRRKRLSCYWSADSE